MDKIDEIKHSKTGGRKYMELTGAFWQDARKEGQKEGRKEGKKAGIKIGERRGKKGRYRRSDYQVNSGPICPK